MLRAGVEAWSGDTVLLLPRARSAGSSQKNSSPVLSKADASQGRGRRIQSLLLAETTTVPVP